MTHKAQSTKSKSDRLSTSRQGTQQQINAQSNDGVTSEPEARSAVSKQTSNSKQSRNSSAAQPCVVRVSRLSKCHATVDQMVNQNRKSKETTAVECHKQKARDRASKQPYNQVACKFMMTRKRFTRNTGKSKIAACSAVADQPEKVARQRWLERQRESVTSGSHWKVYCCGIAGTQKEANAFIHWSTALTKKLQGTILV